MISRRYTHLAAQAAVILVAGLAAAFGVTSLGSASAAGTSAPTPGIGLIKLGSSITSSNLTQYSMIIGDSATAPSLAGLPGRTLAYFTGTDVQTNYSTGVPYVQAAANNWLLRDSAGNLLVNKGYSSDYVGDVGDAGYQQAWATNVLAYLANHPGVKGVFVDDVIYDLKPLAGVEAAKYPTQSQWAAAQLSFVQYVGNALRSHGYYVLVNASGYIPGDSNSDNGTNTVNWWKQVGPYVSGMMNEYFQETSNGTNTLRATGSSWTQNWDGWQRLVTTAQSMGKDFVGLTYGGGANTNAMMYGKASFLLDWNGGGSVLMYAPMDSSDPWNSSWTSSIGTPAAAKQQVGSGWLRYYTQGVALVNPSAVSSQTFALSGTYTTPSGTTTSSVTLAPTTAMILTSTGVAPTPTTTASTTTTTASTSTTSTTTTTSTPTTTTTITTAPEVHGNGKGKGKPTK